MSLRNGVPRIPPRLTLASGRATAPGVLDSSRPAVALRRAAGRPWSISGLPLAPRREGRPPGRHRRAVSASQLPLVGADGLERAVMRRGDITVDSAGLLLVRLRPRADGHRLRRHVFRRHDGVTAKGAPPAHRGSTGASAATALSGPVRGSRRQRHRARSHSGL